MRVTNNGVNLEVWVISTQKLTCARLLQVTYVSRKMKS